MIGTTATVDSILASSYKKISWLFDVTDSNSNQYYWSTKSYAYNGQTYEYKVTGFNGITINRLRSELGIISSSDLSFSIDNKDNVITASDLENGTVVIRLVMSSGKYEEVVRTWKFVIQDAIGIYQEININCQDFIQQYLEGYYPNTNYISSIFPSDRYEDVDLCVPVVFGTCYIPLRPVVYNSSRYYLLGDGDKTFTISRVRSPREVSGKSEWLSTSYSFTQSTISDPVNGDVWKVFQPIIADSNSDGTPDSCGVWAVQGQYCYDMPTQFSCSDTLGTTNPADVINYVIKDFGISSSYINDTTFSASTSTFSGWGLEFNGAFYYKQERSKVLSTLLNQAHATLYNNEQIELHILSSISQKTITSADVIKNSDVGKGTFLASNITQDQSDSGYIAFQESGESQDEFVKYLVPAKSSTDNISSEILEIPFVQDSENAQKIGSLYYQRRLLEESNRSFVGKAKLAALQPDDVITISEDNYGGSYNVLIDSMTFNKDASIQFNCIKFKEALDDWEDLSFGAATIATESTTNYWSPVICGPDSTLTGNDIPNQLRGRLRIGQTGNYILLDPSDPIQRFVEGGVTRFELGDLGTDDYGIKIYDHSGVLIFKLDGGGVNTFCGWFLSENGLASSATEADATIFLNSASADIRVGASTGNYLTIDGDNQRIQSSDYVSGAMGAGFSLSPELLEVGNISARGMLKTSVFEKASISAIGGNLLVRPADVLDVTMGTSDSEHLITKGSETFATNDIVRIKNETYDEWLKVTGTSGTDYTVTRDMAGDYSANTNPSWTKGAAIVNYGQADDGGIFMTSSETNAPYISIFTINSTPWDGVTTRARFGNLNGYLGYSSDLYGVGIGDSDAYLKYDPTNGLRIKGDISSGKIDYSSATAGFWFGDDNGTYKLNIGDEDSFFKWSGSGIDATLRNVSFYQDSAPDAALATLYASSGSLSTGDYSYRITFLTESGETGGGTISNTVTILSPSSSGRISLSNIPVGGEAVTSRKIYRTIANGSSYKFLAEINDNTTTTYIDNIADGDLGDYIYYANTTGGVLSIGGKNVFHCDPELTSVGYEAGQGGRDNVFVGFRAGWLNVYGKNSVFIGRDAGLSYNGGGGNTFVGYRAGANSNSGENNVCIGLRSGDANVSGERNTFVGTSAGKENLGDSSICIGCTAGYWETGSNKLYITNESGSNSTDGIAKATIYGDLSSGDLQFKGNLTQADGKHVKTDKVRAIDGDGLYLVDDGGNGIFVKDGGNVGIGTNTPNEHVSVVKEDARLSIVDLTASGRVECDARLLFGRNASNSRYASLGMHSGDNGFHLDYDLGGNGFFVFESGGSEVVRIANDGKVGIGDTDPSNGSLVVASGVVIGSDSSNNQIDDSSNGSGSSTLYIGNKSITTAFTACHYYQLGDLDLRSGELVSLYGGRIYRTIKKCDKSAIGIFWGITNFKDSLGNELVQEKHEFIDGIKKKNNELVLTDNKTLATKKDFAYAVACIGDSYEEHTDTPLNGAWVTVDNGKIETGDYLCSSSRAGYLEKQDDDIIHNYTVGKAMQSITEDTKTAYIYLIN